MKFRHAMAVLALALLPGFATAGAIKTFSQAEFDRLQKSGQPVLVDVWAGWCPTCRAQKPIIEKLMAAPAYKAVTVLKVDFDGDKSVLRAFRVFRQSTLIAFKGGQEVGRSIGDTSADGIEGLIQKTVR